MSHLQAAVDHLAPLISTEVGVSSWVTVDQKMIDEFAVTTKDEQWIHVDPERAARETPFGGSIAHGFLTLSLASSFVYECFPKMDGQVMGINYGLNKLRFLAPVKAGAELRGRFTLKAAHARSERELMRENLLTIEIKNEETPALVAEWLGLAIFES